jgi:hypothetical protein
VVRRRTDPREVEERSHADMHVGAAAHDREQERATSRAACVVQRVVAHDQQPVRTLHYLELLALDTGEGFEGGPRRRPAARAMTVPRIPELILDSVANRAAPTASPKQHKTKNRTVREVESLEFVEIRSWWAEPVHQAGTARLGSLRNSWGASKPSQAGCAGTTPTDHTAASAATHPSPASHTLRCPTLDLERVEDASAHEPAVTGLREDLPIVEHDRPA